MTTTATRNECARCGAASLPGLALGCPCDDTLTLFELAPAPAVRIIEPTSLTETAAQYRARLAAHHAETVAFFAGLTL